MRHCMIDSVGKDTLNDAAQWESGPHGWVSAKLQWMPGRGVRM